MKQHDMKQLLVLVVVMLCGIAGGYATQSTATGDKTTEPFIPPVEAIEPSGDMSGELTPVIRETETEDPETPPEPLPSDIISPPVPLPPVEGEAPPVEGEPAEGEEAGEEGAKGEEVPVEEAPPEPVDMFEVNAEIPVDMTPYLETEKGRALEAFALAGENVEMQKTASLAFAQIQNASYTQVERNKASAKIDRFQALMPDAKEISLGDVGIFGVDYKLIHPPLKVGDLTLLSSADIAGLCGARLTVDPDNGNFVLDNPTVFGEFILGESYAYINEKPIGLPMKVFHYEGATYLPAAVCMTHFKVPYAQVNADTFLIFWEVG